MIISAKDRIKLDEGFCGTVYQCTAGANTIGYGRNLDQNPITQAEAEYLLDNDLKKIARQAQKFAFYQTLSTERRGVIINMIYNLGITRFNKFSKMISALFIEDYEKAAKEMLDSKWARQVGDRAIRLARIMRSGA